AIERLHGLLEGCLGIVPVSIQYVQGIGLQTLEALLAFPLNLDLGQAARATWIIEAQLGRDRHFVAGAPLLHPLTDGGLALAALASRQPCGIEVPGIDKRPALFAKQ